MNKVKTNHPKGTRVAVLFADGIYSGDTQKAINDYAKPVKVKFDDGEIAKIYPCDMVIVEDSDFDGGVTIFGFKPKKGDPVIGQRVCMNCNGGMFTGIMQGVLPDDGATMRERLSVLLDTGEEREPYRRNVITLGPEPEISSVVIRSQPGEGLLNSELVVGNTIEYKKRKPSNKVHEAVVKKIIGDYGVRIKVVGIRAWQTVPMGNIVSIIHRQPLASI